MAKNSPKTTKEVWEQVRLEFEQGNFKTLHELALKHNIHPTTLRSRILNQNWNEQKQEKNQSFLNKVEQIKEDLATNYLKRVFKRAERYEKIIDISQKQLASHISEGEEIPIMDCEAINDYSLAEQRIHELAKSALRIPDVRQDLDVTSKGQSIGESLVSAIAKLRQDKSMPVVTDIDVDRILEAEIVDDNSDKLKS